ncbi:hypothetical protein EDD69_101242 [Thermolongibacillus altinsuensis]|uniref:DUF1795 domain-containing protein n=1 Tax=Thermolongibacillus altinsuensis TaxID=575256 RepID=A0A4R1QR10_9BACL|nr:hypothetical protein [Thermolongibacillus altinsuensis]TCL53234.1 hypothetical protein EDD69_101242 [Thermolongibacillus altinsuensis]
MKKLWNVLTVMTIVSMLLAACSGQKTEQRVKPAKEDQPASEQADALDLTYVESDNQNFAISLLPDYTLEAEEPGKDVVLNKKDGDQLMRIELLPSDINVNELEANAKERAIAVASDATPFEGFLPFKEAIAYEAHVDDSIVYVVFVKQDVPMFLTVFTKNETNLFEEFMTMARTIIPLDSDTSEANEDEKANNETFLYKSSSQPFQARVINGYNAEAIEPGKDMIFQDENEASMTIEILDDEADWALVSEQAETYVKESSKDGNVETMTWQEGNKLKGADVYQAQTKDGAVYVFVVKSVPMRLTIFTTGEQKDLSPFLTMAETIERID